MPYDFTHMLNLKSKINKQNRYKLIDTQIRLMMSVREEGDKGVDEKGKGIKKYKLVVKKYSHGCKI